MCDFSQGFCFCTCSELVQGEVVKDKGLARWILKRYKGLDWLDLEMGRCSIMDYTKYEQENADWILYHLNHSDCFDFDYQPMTDDVLNIEVIQENNQVFYEFVFINGQWQQVESISEHLNQDKLIYQGIMTKHHNKLG